MLGKCLGKVNKRMMRVLRHETSMDEAFPLPDVDEAAEASAKRHQSIEKAAHSWSSEILSTKLRGHNHIHRAYAWHTTSVSSRPMIELVDLSNERNIEVVFHDTTGSVTIARIVHSYETLLAAYPTVRSEWLPTLAEFTMCLSHDPVHNKIVLRLRYDWHRAIKMLSFTEYVLACRENLRREEGFVSSYMHPHILSFYSTHDADMGETYHRQKLMCMTRIMQSWLHVRDPSFHPFKLNDKDYDSLTALERLCFSNFHYLMILFMRYFKNRAYYFLTFFSSGNVGLTLLFLFFYSEKIDIIDRDCITSVLNFFKQRSKKEEPYYERHKQLYDIVLGFERFYSGPASSLVITKSDTPLYREFCLLRRRIFILICDNDINPSFTMFLLTCLRMTRLSVARTRQLFEFRQQLAREVNAAHAPIISVGEVDTPVDTTNLVAAQPIDMVVSPQPGNFPFAEDARRYFETMEADHRPPAVMAQCKYRLDSATLEPYQIFLLHYDHCFGMPLEYFDRERVQHYLRLPEIRWPFRFRELSPEEAKTTGRTHRSEYLDDVYFLVAP